MEIEQLTIVELKINMEILIWFASCSEKTKLANLRKAHRTSCLLISCIFCKIDQPCRNNNWAVLLSVQQNSRRSSHLKLTVRCKLIWCRFCSLYFLSRNVAFILSYLNTVKKFNNLRRVENGNQNLDTTATNKLYSDRK